LNPFIKVGEKKNARGGEKKKQKKGPPWLKKKKFTGKFGFV